MKPLPTHFQGHRAYFRLKPWRFMIQSKGVSDLVTTKAYRRDWIGFVGIIHRSIWYYWTKENTMEFLDKEQLIVTIICGILIIIGISI